MIAGIRETIERGQVTGEISVGHSADDLALFVFNAMQGLRVLGRPASPADRQRHIAIASPNSL